MTTDPLDPQTRERAAELAAGYTAGSEWLNRLGVCSGVALAVAWGGRLLAVAPEGFWPATLAMTLLGALAADLFTGLIHWGCDTWGTAEAPWVGRTLIRTFREHHVDPQSITRHDWAEINGEACLGATLALGALHMGFPIATDTFLVGWGLECFIVASMFTNQLHKWAHMPRAPRLARWLQGCRLILTPQAHRGHHTRPFAHSYCITTGWLNPLLNTIGFWRHLERVLHDRTGALPREDDLGREAAQEAHAYLFGPDTGRSLKG
jgi:hypothetical protein